MRAWADRSILFRTRKTWTTDALYREPPIKIAKRKKVGCPIVEMESAGMMAVAQFRKVLFGQAWYGGDDHDVVGIDSSPLQIAVAERYRSEEGGWLRLEYLVDHQATLLFEYNSLDGATFCNSLECLGDPEALLREVVRVLKPGSVVAIWGRHG